MTYFHDQIIIELFFSLQILEKGLVVFAYQSDSLGKEEKGENPPITVSLKLPDYVAFFKTPHVAQWDAAGRRPTA